MIEKGDLFMYVVISKYLDYKNENILAVTETIEQAKTVIQDHFNEHYQYYLNLTIEGNIGYVSGYSIGDPKKREKEYVIVEPYLKG